MKLKIKNFGGGKFLPGALYLILLSGCITGSGGEGVDVYQAQKEKDKEEVYLSLVNAANEIEQSSARLVRMKDPKKEKGIGSIDPALLPKELLIETYIDWVGPLEPLLKKLSTVANYDFVILGKTPVVPILVNTSDRPEPLYLYFENVALQTTGIADIVVDAERKLIELRYRKK